jgi:hypothetical protein
VEVERAPRAARAAASPPLAAAKKADKKLPPVEWRTTSHVEYEPPEFEGDEPLPHAAWSGFKTPAQWFRVLFTATITARLCECTNRSAKRKYEKWTDVKDEELLAVFGALLLMGTAPMSHIKRYWDHRFGLPAVREAFGRDRFLRIVWSLNCHDTDDAGTAAATVAAGDDTASGDDSDTGCDDDFDHDDDDAGSGDERAEGAREAADGEGAAFAVAEPPPAAPPEAAPADAAALSSGRRCAAADPEGRFAAVHWLVDSLNAQFARLVTPGEHICIDELMIKYRGKHPSVMLMPAKPIKRGFKGYVLGTAKGYLLHITLCSGASADSTVETKSIKDVVLMLVEPYCGVWRRLTMDNYYNFIPLYVLLWDRKLLATGTIRNNRQQFPESHRHKGTPALRAASKAGGGVQCSQHPTLPALFVVSYFRTHLKDDQRHYLTTAHARPHHMAPKASERRRAAAAARRSAGGSAASGGAAAAEAASASASSSSAPAAEPPAAAPAKTIPRVAADYNQRMNVIDEANRWAAMYTPWRRAKRWWFSITMGFVHIAVANAWVLYRSTIPPEEQLQRTFGQWTDALALELIALKPRKKTARPTLQAHNYAQSIHRTRKRPIQGRCSVCCLRTTSPGINRAAGVSQRTEDQVGRQTPWFCRECSHATLRVVYVCDNFDCRAHHAAAPPPPAAIRPAE